VQCSGRHRALGRRSRLPRQKKRKYELACCFQRNMTEEDRQAGRTVRGLAVPAPGHRPPGPWDEAPRAKPPFGSPFEETPGSEWGRNHPSDAQRPSSRAGGHRCVSVSSIPFALALLFPALLGPGTARAHALWRGSSSGSAWGARALGHGGSAFVGPWPTTATAALLESRPGSPHSPSARSPRCTAEQFGSIVQYDFLSYVMPVGAARQAAPGDLGFAGPAGASPTSRTRAASRSSTRTGTAKFDYPGRPARRGREPLRLRQRITTPLCFSAMLATSVPGSRSGETSSTSASGSATVSARTASGSTSGCSTSGRASPWERRFVDATHDPDPLEHRNGRVHRPHPFVSARPRRAGSAIAAHLVTAALDVAGGLLRRAAQQPGAPWAASTFEFHPGLEYWYDRRLALRAGIRGRRISPRAAGLRLPPVGPGLRLPGSPRSRREAHRVSGSYSF